MTDQLSKPRSRRTSSKSEPRRVPHLKEPIHQRQLHLLPSLVIRQRQQPMRVMRLTAIPSVAQVDPDLFGTSPHGDLHGGDFFLAAKLAFVESTFVDRGGGEGRVKEEGVESFELVWSREAGSGVRAGEWWRGKWVEDKGRLVETNGEARCEKKEANALD
jgi:hypothetical protein